jgi:cytochrome c556
MPRRPFQNGINHHAVISRYAQRGDQNNHTDPENGGAEMNTKEILGMGAAVALCAIAGAAGATEEKHPALAYRESAMTLIGANFGPMMMSMKGEIPWDDKRIAGYGKDLAALATLNLMRGFPPGSDKGKTHAKPAIWKNLEDFTKKMEDFQSAAAKLGQVAAGGDRKAIEEQIKATGKTCGSCHDDYKEKDD